MRQAAVVGLEPLDVDLLLLVVGPLDAVDVHVAGEAAAQLQQAEQQSQKRDQLTVHFAETVFSFFSFFQKTCFRPSLS